MRDEKRLCLACPETGVVLRLLTVRDVALLLSVTPKAVYQMVHRDEVPGIIRVGKRLRFDSRLLLEWLSRKRVMSPKDERR